MTVLSLSSMELRRRRRSALVQDPFYSHRIVGRRAPVCFLLPEKEKLTTAVALRLCALGLSHPGRPTHLHWLGVVIDSGAEGGQRLTLQQYAGLRPSCRWRLSGDLVESARVKSQRIRRPGVLSSE